MSLFSTIGAVSGIIGEVSGIVNVIDALASGNYAALLSGMGAWANGMQVATWRGVPFAVRESMISKGRRLAEHVYPFRDTIYAEDLGRGVRRYTFRGFLVGDDVLQQSQAMQAAAEQPGPGKLVHPALGSLICAVREFSVRQTVRGRMVEIEFDFVETAPVLYPSILSATQSLLGTAATGSFGAILGDFQNDIVAPLQMGADIARSVVSTVSGWASIAFGLVGDASLIAHSVSGLVGNNGRYGGAGLAKPQPVTASTASLLAASTTARSALLAATTAATTLPSGTSAASEAAEIAVAVAAVSEAVRAAAQSPADQVRLLAEIASYAPVPPASTSAIGGAIVTATDATAALCRRSALTSLSLACSNYLPASSQDALTLMGAVTALLDAEMIVAADGADLATWQAFRVMRSAVVSDLTLRAAQLPAQRTVTSKAPLPSLAIAYRLYEDASRSDDLIARADPVHPAFMPLSFEALAA